MTLTYRSATVDGLKATARCSRCACKELIRRKITMENRCKFAALHYGSEWHTASNRCGAGGMVWTSFIGRVQCGQNDVRGSVMGST